MLTKSKSVLSSKKVLSDGHLLAEGQAPARTVRSAGSLKAMSRIVMAIMLVLSHMAAIPFLDLSSKAVAQSNSSSKLSADLRDKMNRSGPQDRIQVILRTPAAPSKQLIGAAKSSGSVARTFQNINAITLNLPAQAIAALAARSDVNYVSIDRPTKSTGHLETTTGADQARSYGTSSTGTIDGTGIGIAILDSGIYAGHSSFGGSKSRVVTSIDFTGENRTDDPYGHGTHVASCAAANSSVSWGAYTGIAPNANLINVRVLDSTGQGLTSNAIAGI